MTNIVSFKARSVNQQKYIDSIRNNIYTICLGASGTGKTFIATAMALAYLEQQKIRKIVVIRPAIVNKYGEQIGSTPGTLAEKMWNFAGSIIDNLSCWLMPEQIQEMLEDGRLEFLPITYIRGRSFNNCFIICEEAQNIYPGGLYTILARIGENSKCVIAGDHLQSDIGEKSDLINSINKISKPTLLPQFGIVKLDQKQDVIRNPALYEIMQRFGQV